MRGGLIQRSRRQRVFKVLLGLGSILFLLLSVVARAEVADSQAIAREHVANLVGQPQGPALAGQALSLRTHQISSLLRCTTCQGSSVADSPSTGALNMRQEVADLLAAGFTQEQILAYFEAKYGQFVLLQPKAEGLNLLVWIGPGLLLLLGAGILVVYLRRRPDEAEAPAPERIIPASRAALPEDDQLAAWVRKVRELAYGWPEGEPPGGTS